MNIRTSVSSPLRIDEVSTANGGVIGLTICPGKKDLPAGWDRDLATDMRVIAEWGAANVISLIEEHEFKMLSVGDLPEMASSLGITWIHLPIRDVSIPDFRFHGLWLSTVCELLDVLMSGKKLLIHCRGGLGRSGLVAALLLIESGVNSREAVGLVRAARPGAIETIQQEAYVRGYQAVSARVSHLAAKKPMDGICTAQEFT